MTIIIFLLVLTVLIFVHELGHFSFAKLFKVRVDEFSIGFPPRIFSWIKGETKYSLNLIPFGGYVAIHGENPDEEALTGQDKERSLIHKPRWQQILIMFAGILFNFIFAWVVLWAILFWGANSMPVESGYPTTNDRVEIVMVAENSPASVAGLAAGDKIIAFNFTQVEPNATSVKTIQDSIAASETAVNFIVMRNDEELQIAVEPNFSTTSNKQIVGIYMAAMGDYAGNFWTSPWYAVKYLWAMTEQMVLGLGDLLFRAFQQQATMDEISGPVGIAKIIGQAYEQSFQSLLLMMVLISINLAILNLIPFPALDGGRILFLLVEAIIEPIVRLVKRDKKYKFRLPMVFQNWANMIGFMILIGFMIFVTYNDIVKLF